MPLLRLLPVLLPVLLACRFPAMIADWRRRFQQALPFFIAELAGFQNTDLTALRAAAAARPQAAQRGLRRGDRPRDPHGHPPA